MHEAEGKRAASREWGLRQKIGLFLGPIMNLLSIARL